MNPFICRKKEAIKLGLDKYFTGKPCKYGHVAYRLVINNNCNSCKNVYSARWRIKNPGKHKISQVKTNENKKLKHIEIRKNVITHYGGKCVCCGEAELNFLTIDHINGKGRAHRKAIKKRNIYWWLAKNKHPNGFRILCWNCNCAIGVYGFCPHQRTSLICLPA